MVAIYQLPVGERRVAMAVDHVWPYVLTCKRDSLFVILDIAFFTFAIREEKSVIHFNERNRGRKVDRAPTISAFMEA